MPTPPIMYILAGPNGAGKSTVAAQILPEFNTTIFVNADEIQKQRQCSSVEAAAQLLLAIDALESSRITCAFETTLAARSYAKLIERAQTDNYIVHLIYIWLRTPILAKRRVADRVRDGGHDIPSDVIERRYWRGLDNLQKRYLPLVDVWTICDNSTNTLSLVAKSSASGEKIVLEPDTYREFVDAAKNAKF